MRFKLLHTFVYWTFVLLMAIHVVACTDDGLLSSPTEEEVVVSFRPGLDSDLQTRAIAKAERINQLIVTAYDEDGKEVCRTTQGWTPNTAANISLRLLRGHSYDILFWAQHSGVYTIASDGSVSINYSDHTNSGFTDMENLDAFYAVRKIEAGSVVGDNTVSLNRPLAQLNFADDKVKPEQGKHTAAITLNGIATTFNPLSNNSTAQGDATAAFTFTDFPDEALMTNGVTNHYVASLYLFPVSNLSVNYQLLENEQELQNRDFYDIQLFANKRTNFIGAIVQAPEDMWDGFTLTAVEGDGTEQNPYIIDACAKLAWLQDNGNTLSGGIFAITKELNMQGHELKALQIPNGSTIKGDNHIIKNLNLTGALFGDVTNITVDNLTIDGAKVTVESTEQPTHVGALVNTLKGSSTFTNVIVKNAEVTTNNGAAGGIVGYIVRKDKDNREEELNVTFNGCSVENNEISGTLNEGHFVGLLRGYDSGEKLAFNNGCSVKTPKNTINAYYINSNKACFVEPDLSEYDGWLGCEECYRGTVNYGENRFLPKWDGVIKVEPLEETTDNGSTYKAIYSAFDLAYLQGGTHTHVKFKGNVDLGGNRTDKTNAFTPIGSIQYLDGEQNTLYNLYVEVNDMGGFISQAAGESTHENLTFENSSVVVHFVTLNGKEDRGYAGTLTPVVWSGTNYVVNNIKVNNGYVFGLGKIGGLIGYIDEGTTGSTITECTVSGTTVKNEKGKTLEDFYGIAKFYAHGEAGGLIGMIMGDSRITNCHVSNSTMDCYGEKNQTLAFIVTIQGRHVNNFIGNIRTRSGQVITIDDCSATNNTYITADGKRKDDPYKPSRFSQLSTNLVGEPYYLNAVGIINVDTKGSVKIDGDEYLK